MPNKIFSIYASSEIEPLVEIDDRLLLEIGRSYVSCILLKEKSRSISAFELFTFNEKEAAAFPLLFSSISKKSLLLNKSYSKTEIFINNELSVLVPVFQFDKQIAKEYLNIVFGEDDSAIALFEHLPFEHGMMNAYRISTDCYNELNANFTNPSFRHTWPKIITNLAAKPSLSSTALIYLLIYDKYITVVILKDEKVELIQSFVYDTPEDVLYYLLNITERLQLTNDLALRLSGLFDLDFKLYRELIKYFETVSVEYVDASRLTLDYKEHPLHYFTPFFNLAT